MDLTEIAWAAGFFDGEGHTGYHRHGHANGLSLDVSQAEPSTLERFREAVGIGAIYGPTHVLHHTPMYQYKVSGPVTQHVIAILWGYLSEPKREQAKRCLTQWASKKNKWQVCSSLGHEIVRNSMNGHYCKPCANAKKMLDWHKKAKHVAG